MKYSSAEVKSGFLIVLSMGLLIGLCFAVGGSVSGKSRDWQVRFGYISGLEKNAPVYYAGHEVGKVSGIEIIPSAERSVLLTLRMKESIQLRSDSDAFVDTLGLMGEKFLEVTPGSIGSPDLDSGSVLEGTDPIPVHVMVRKMNLLADLMEDLTLQLNPMIEKLNGFMTGHEEEIAKTLANLQETSANVRDMTHDLKFRPWRLVRKDS